MKTVNCSSCGEERSYARVPREWTCTKCKTRNVRDGETTRPATPTEESESLVGIFDGESESSRDVSFSIESDTKDFPRIAEPEARTTSQNITLNTQPTVKPQAQPVAWEAETIEPLFAVIDETMVSMSNSEVWNVSKRTEKKLSQLWADVLNEYTPKADSKKIKLGVALTATIGTYAYQSKRYYDAYQHYKKRTPKQEKKPEVETQTQLPMTEEQKLEATQPPQRDNDFAEKWKAKTGG